MLAFENGAPDPGKFANRVDELETKANALGARQAALTADSIPDAAALPRPAELRRLAAWLRTVSHGGLAAERKAVAQAFVQELVVQARDHVQPTFKIRPPLTQHDDQSGDANPDGTGARRRDELRGP